MRLVRVVAPLAILTLVAFVLLSGPEYGAVRDGRCLLDTTTVTNIDILPAPIPADEERYTQHACVGTNVHDRACRFRNVCYDTLLARWIAYVPWDDRAPIVEGPSAGAACPLTHEYPSDFLSARIEVDGAQLVGPLVAPVVRHGPAPSMEPRGARWMPDAETYFMNLHAQRSDGGMLWPGSFGHFLIEAAAALFDMHATLPARGSLADARLLFVAAPEGAESRRVAEILVPMISAPPSSLSIETDVDGDRGLVCFPRLTTGFARYHLSATHVNPALARIRQFRDHLYHLHNCTDTARIVLVLTKAAGRRVPFMPALRANFSGMETITIDPARTPFAEQVRLIARASVLVSPCGGISVLGVLLRDGSSFVSLCQHDPVTHCPLTPEAYLWPQVPHVRHVLYPVDPARDIDLRDIDWARAEHPRARRYIEGCTVPPPALWTAFAKNDVRVRVDRARLERVIEWELWRQRGR